MNAGPIAGSSWDAERAVHPRPQFLRAESLSLDGEWDPDDLRRAERAVTPSGRWGGTCRCARWRHAHHFPEEGHQPDLKVRLGKHPLDRYFAKLISEREDVFDQLALSGDLGYVVLNVSALASVELFCQPSLALLANIAKSVRVVL